MISEGEREEDERGEAAGVGAGHVRKLRVVRGTRWFGRPDSLAWLEPGEGSRARAELVGLDPQALEHAHVEVAERGRVLRVERQVLAVPEAAAGQEDGQVPRGVTATVTEVAPKEHGRAVEERV